MSEYLQKVITSHAVNTTNLPKVMDVLTPIINTWGNGKIVKAYYSGSLAKGTGVSPGTDADVFISLTSDLDMTLKDIYDSLYNALAQGKQGMTIRKQNVSIGVDILGLSIDLVPGKRQSQYGNNHSLYKSKTDTWIQTDVDKHITIVKNSNRIDEIKILKIWRNINKLSFPSFFLELTAIDSLKNKKNGDLAKNVWSALHFIRDNIETVSYFDPSNTNNKISDDCTVSEKKLISDTAKIAVSKKNWGQIVR